MPSEWTEKLSILFDQHPAAPWVDIQPAIYKELNDSKLVKYAAAIKNDNNNNVLLPVTSYRDTTGNNSMKRRDSLVGTVLNRVYSLTSTNNKNSEDAEDWKWIEDTINMLNDNNNNTSIEDKLFTHIEHEALAAATIAQVHVAYLRYAPPFHSNSDKSNDNSALYDEKKKVVFKVQKLGVEALIKSDLRNMKKVARFLRPYLPFDLTPIADESYIQIPLEFDFEREMNLMKRIRSSLLENGHNSILVPRAVEELSSPRLIVMEYMAGIPFSKILKVKQQLDRDGENSSDPEEFQDIVHNLLPLVENAFRKLLDAFGQMIFIDGTFHADPHAGNLLLKHNGDIVLLDFGQSKELPNETILFLSQLVDMLSEGDEDTIIEAMNASGMEMTDTRDGKEAERNVIIKSAYIFFDTRYIEEATENPFDPENSLIKYTNVGFNSEMWMIVRFIVLLRGMFYQFNLDISAVDIWQKYAQKALDRLMTNPELLKKEEDSNAEDRTESMGDPQSERILNTKPPSSVQMIQLRRFSIWLAKFDFISDRSTMKKFYINNILTPDDIATYNYNVDSLSAVLVDWERVEVQRLYTIAKNKDLQHVR